MSQTLNKDESGYPKDGESAASVEQRADTVSPQDAANTRATLGNEGNGSSKSGAWIRRCVEYRDLRDTLLSRRDRSIETEDAHAYKDAKTPAFEHVIQHRVSEFVYEELKGATDEKGVPLLLPTGSTPTQLLRISSVAIIHALRSVVEYYPSQDLSGDVIEIHWPYPILAHHYDELSQFQQERAAKDPETLCHRERNASEHLHCLLQFLDEEIMPGFREERQRNERKCHTFEHLWVGFKPGRTVLSKTTKSNVWRAHVILSISGGTFTSPPTGWRIKHWSMAFNGTYLGRVADILMMPKFDGEQVFNSIFYDQEPENSNIKKQILYGEEYWRLLNKECRWYKGETAEFPHNKIDGLVMVDLKSYYTQTNKDIPILMNEIDCRNWRSNCMCTICSGNRTEKLNMKSEFDGYNKISKINWVWQNGLTDHMYLLCPPLVCAFVFKTRAWELLDIGNLEPPKFDKSMIDNLVMNQNRLKTLQYLTKSFARLNKAGEQLGRETWAADFVKGKGNGLIFLLHGGPGVGKTFTAECIADYLERPLMILTTSDIGIEPEEVEQKLTRIFKTAKSWDAVLLIDEADIFLAQRTTADLRRNSLVASFLRALEYYDGILFLTTNRVGSFDDAIISRVHIQLYYPDLDKEQRIQVWKTFIDKLEEDTKGSMPLRVHNTVKEYLEGDAEELRTLNGRQIRNAFQTAVALAEYDAKKDSDGKTVLMKDQHLKDVLELSKEFKSHMFSINQSELDWAQRMGERPSGM